MSAGVRHVLRRVCRIWPRLGQHLCKQAARLGPARGRRLPEMRRSVAAWGRHAADGSNTQMFTIPRTMEQGSMPPVGTVIISVNFLDAVVMLLRK